MNISDYIKQIKTNPDFSGAVVHHRHLPSVRPIYGPHREFHKGIGNTVKNIDLDRLFIHQVEAIDTLRTGANVMVTTPTASAVPTKAPTPARIAMAFRRFAPAECGGAMTS